MDERFKVKLIVKLMITFVRLDVMDPTCPNVSSEVAQVGPICTGPYFGSPYTAPRFRPGLIHYSTLMCLMTLINYILIIKYSILTFRAS